MLASYAARLALSTVRQLQKPPVALFDAVRLSMRVWPWDVDPYLHLNNGRYLTLMDIGRYQWAQRTGLLSLMWKRSWWPVLGGAHVRFRRELALWQGFELVTRFVGWQGKWFYIEQSFVARDTLHASGMVRGVFRHRGRTISCDEVMEAMGHRVTSPEIPELCWDAPKTEGADPRPQARPRPALDR